MPAVSAIIFNPEKTAILLIKRRDVPVWVLPGGGIEPGEMPEAAVVREAEEETGLKVVIKRKVAVYHPANRITHVTHLFECTPITGELQTGTETKAIAYFPLDKLPDTFVPFYRYWVADALANHPAPVEKTIQGTSYWKLIYYLLTHPLLTVRFLLTKLGIHINT